MDDMSETDLAAVQAAVRLARDRQIRRKEVLHQALTRNGFSDEEAGRALKFWGEYERSKKRAQPVSD